jgi:hypothetical protein
MGDDARRRGSDSRVCKPWDAPYAWQMYLDPEHSGAQGLAEWLEGLSEFNQNHIEGQIDDLFDAAEQGELEDTGDEKTPIKPVHPNPEIFELRLKQLNKKLRFYHGEPDFMPSALVSIHEHIKTTNKAQSLEIGFAAKRYQRGRSSYWR